LIGDADCEAWPGSICELERAPVEYVLYVEMLLAVAFLGVVAVSLVLAVILDLREKLGG